MKLEEELKLLEQVRPANEAEVETKLLLHLFRLLGFTDVDRADKPAVVMSFGHQRMVKHPDFVLYAGPERSVANALIAVEAKAVGVPLEAGEDQARSYALWAGTPVYLICNGTTLRAVQFLPGAQGYRALQCEVVELARKWEEIATFLSRSEVILTKERLEYTAEYLPQIELLPPRDFFQEYLSRLQDRFSLLATVPASALEPPAEQETVLPRIPVSVRLSSAESVKASEGDLAAQLIEGGRKLLITGSPGSGKSTMCRRLVSELASREMQAPEDVIPIYVRLALHVPESVLDALGQSCREMGIRFLPNLFRRQLASAKPVVILDGLDEADPSDLTRAKLARLSHDSAWGLLLTTRPIALGDFEASLPIQDFTQGEIRPLTDLELREVLETYLQEYATVDALLATIPLELREDLRSPLFALMAIRVAQVTPDWSALTKFQLFRRYVQTLDDFFNAATVRGIGGRRGSAVRGVALAAMWLSQRQTSARYSLHELATLFKERDLQDDFRALLNTGLLLALLCHIRASLLPPVG